MTPETEGTNCIGSTQLLKLEEDLALNEQHWYKEPDSEIQTSSGVYGPCYRGPTDSIESQHLVLKIIYLYRRY